MLATAPSPGIGSRSNNNTNTTGPTTTLLTKNDLIAIHHFQQQFDASSSCNSVWILNIYKTTWLPATCSHTDTIIWVIFTICYPSPHSFSFNILIRWVSVWWRREDKKRKKGTLREKVRSTHNRHIYGCDWLIEENSWV
jgi:hypothetical protein